jgi:23S rRNA pseudouridine1911/1915/1917 synthase
MKPDVEKIALALSPWATSSHLPLPFRESRMCSLLWEDRAILVVDKAPGVLTVPTDRGEDRTVLGALGRYVRSRYKSRQKPVTVHRLDRGTSGILVFAKDERSAHELIEQFKGRKPERIYLAIVAGLVREDKGTIRTHLVSDKFLNQHSVQKRSGKKTPGVEAVTHFEVVGRIHGATLIKVQLETGRRNQIRTQFAELGHPVLGDDRYQTQLATHTRWRHKRLALHAATLAFNHPFRKDVMRFRSKIPGEFWSFIGTSPVTEVDSR